MMDEINASKMHGIIYLVMCNECHVHSMYNCSKFFQSEYLTKLIFMFEFKLGMCRQNLDHVQVSKTLKILEN